MLQLKVPHATTKIEDPACHNCDLVQPNKLKLKKKKGDRRQATEMEKELLAQEKEPGHSGSWSHVSRDL